MSAPPPEPAAEQSEAPETEPLHTMRKPCTRCSGLVGTITPTNGQDVVHCARCGDYQYCAPRAETGRARRTLRSRPQIRPAQRARILARDANRCVFCGRGHAEGAALVIGHLLSVDDAKALGVSEVDAFDDENLAAMCDEDNSGIGRGSVAARLIATLVRHRAAARRESA